MLNQLVAVKVCDPYEADAAQHNKNSSNADDSNKLFLQVFNQKNILPGSNE